MTARKLSTEDVKLAATLIKEGLSVEEVADKFGVSIHHLYHRIAEVEAPVRQLTQTLDGLRKLSLSELRMTGPADIPSEPTVIMVNRKPSHVLMPIDEYRAAKGM